MGQWAPGHCCSRYELKNHQQDSNPQNETILIIQLYILFWLWIPNLPTIDHLIYSILINTVKHKNFLSHFSFKTWSSSFNEIQVLSQSLFTAQSFLFEFSSPTKLLDEPARGASWQQVSKDREPAYKRHDAQLVHSPFSSGPGCWHPHWYGFWCWWCPVAGSILWLVWRLLSIRLGSLSITSWCQKKGCGLPAQLPVSCPHSLCIGSLHSTGKPWR